MVKWLYDIEIRSVFNQHQFYFHGFQSSVVIKVLTWIGGDKENLAPPPRLILSGLHNLVFLPVPPSWKNSIFQLHDKLAKSSKETSELKSALKKLEASVKDIKEESANFKKSASQQEKELSNAVSECERYKSVLATTVRN